MPNSKFQNDKEKLSYIVRDLLEKRNKEVERELGLPSSHVSEFFSTNSVRKLQKYHLFAILFLFNLPKELFTLPNLNTRKKVEKFLTDSNYLKQEYSAPIVISSPKLIGEWFCYTYPDNINARQELYKFLDGVVSYINEEKITIDDTFRVESNIHGVGTLHIYTHQAQIIFEDRYTKDIIEYTFDNDVINNKQFNCIKLSTMKQFKQKIINMGFFSKKSISEHDAHLILDKDISKVQFKSDIDFLERVSAYNEIEDY